MIPTYDMVSRTKKETYIIYIYTVYQHVPKCALCFHVCLTSVGQAARCFLHWGRGCFLGENSGKKEPAPWKALSFRGRCTDSWSCLQAQAVTGSITSESYGRRRLKGMPKRVPSRRSVKHQGSHSPARGPLQWNVTPSRRGAFFSLLP